MKIQLLTNEQVNHLLNSLQRPLTKALDDKIEEIKKIELTDEKIEAEIKVNKKIIEYLKEKDEDFTLVKDIATLMQSLKALNIEIDREAISKRNEWRYHERIEKYLEDSELYQETHEKDVKEWSKTMAENVLSEKANIDSSYHRIDLLKTDLRARLALTKVEDFETIEKTITETININDYLTKL